VTLVVRLRHGRLARHEAQARCAGRLFKDVIGGKALVFAIDREKARKLLDTVKALPPNATSFRSEFVTVTGRPEIPCRRASCA